MCFYNFSRKGINDVDVFMCEYSDVRDYVDVNVMDADAVDECDDSVGELFVW